MELNIVYLKWGFICIFGFSPVHCNSGEQLWVRSAQVDGICGIAVMFPRMCLTSSALCSWSLVLVRGHKVSWPVGYWESADPAVRGCGEPTAQRQDMSYQPQQVTMIFSAATRYHDLAAFAVCDLMLRRQISWVVTAWTCNPSTCCSWPAKLDTLWQTTCSFGYSSH